MALIRIPTDHIKFGKTLSFEKKPLMLKDYLRDDLSSCSSNGFKSFPRQQCCTTVRFLLEADLKKSKDKYSSTAKRLLKRSRSKPGSTTVLALQRASEAVLNAVKLLPFASIKSSSPSLKINSSRKGHFPRSFSKKFFKRSFWRKADKEDHGEIRRWKLFPEFLEEKNLPSDQNTITDVNTTDTSYSTITTSRVSTNTSSNSRAESEFTGDILRSSSCKAEGSSENDNVEGKTNLPEREKVSNIVGVSVGEDSINFTKEQDWPNEEGKEQFSPVSVLDCPFDDEEEDNSSPFEDDLACVEGTKQMLMQKVVRRFEGLAQLEPVDLEKRIAISELEDEPSPESPKELYPVSVNNEHGNMSDEEDKQEKDGEANQKLLKLLKAKIPSDSFKLRADNLLLDFFRERFMVEENNAKRLPDMGLEDLRLDSFKVAEDWVNGNPQELVLGWELQEGRKAYLKQMETNENWRNFNEEKEGVGSAVELEIFSSLMDELLTDLF